MTHSCTCDYLLATASAAGEVVLGRVTVKLDFRHSAGKANTISGCAYSRLHVVVPMQIGGAVPVGLLCAFNEHSVICEVIFRV